VLSDGPEREVTQIARNLERLYFLMSVLLNRTDRTDDTTKLRVTLIGDAAEIQAMDLRNFRWQQGPFNEAFDIRRYYDPRPDGAVLATTRIDQRLVLQHGVSVASALQGFQLPGSGGQPGGAGGQVGQSGLFGLQSSADLIRPINEESVPLSAEGMIYAGFAQHYLTTFFPAAYPRWYLDGFGQLFSTLVVRGDTTIEYGRAPGGNDRRASSLRKLRFGGRVQRSLLHTPGEQDPLDSGACMDVTHFLFFSPTRSGQFREYLKAVARGTPSAEAAAVFGTRIFSPKSCAAIFSPRNRSSG
jgi:hypothetical protein